LIDKNNFIILFYFIFNKSLSNQFSHIIIVSIRISL